jgi:hypothetical protein
MKDMLIKSLWPVVFATVVTGLAYAGDQRIDQRVSEAIRQSNMDRLEQEIEFYIIKKETAGLSGEDRINMEIKERQLKKLLRTQ